MQHQPSVLLVANVAKEHVLKFHVPTIQHLKESGWRVDVACSGSEDVPYCDTQFRMSYKRSPFNFALFKGIRELKKIVRNGNYDLVYCHTPVGGLAARLAARPLRKKGVKVIYCAHGFHFFKGAPLINWLVFYPIEKILSYFTDVIMVINREDHAFAQKHFSRCKIYRINGIGIDLSRFAVEDRAALRKTYRQEMHIPQDAVVLIYLAELLKNKNQTFLMDVLKHILQTRPDTYLVFAGIDHADGAFERYAASIGVADRVRFLGWRKDVGALYAMADICTASSIREGLGLNLVEAMASSLPVVATLNRGHDSILQDGENGFLVPLGDKKLFEERILQLCDDPDLYQKFVQAGLREKDKYTCPAVLRSIDAIFAEQLPAEEEP